eukprot:1162041-Pelagomonas_calceolata.AAC.5
MAVLPTSVLLTVVTPFSFSAIMLIAATPGAFCYCYEGGYHRECCKERVLVGEEEKWGKDGVERFQTFRTVLINGNMLLPPGLNPSKDATTLRAHEVSTGLHDLCSMHNDFERGNTDVFMLTVRDVGRMERIEVRQQKRSVGEMERTLLDAHDVMAWAILFFLACFLGLFLASCLLACLKSSMRCDSGKIE